MSDKPALVLLTRWHAAGRCKNRLAAEIGSFNAASIQKGLTKHTVETAKALEKEGLVEIRLSISGLSTNASKRWGRDLGIKTINLQGNGSLGLRMRRQILRAQHPNKGRTTIIIGTDLPTLCRLDLIRALAALKTHEMVLGPAKDGGYWLIGLSGGLVNPVALWPFAGIPWGSDQVLRRTLCLAERRRVNHYLLQQKNDIDYVNDLTPWQA